MRAGHGCCGLEEEDTVGEIWSYIILFVHVLYIAVLMLCILFDLLLSWVRLELLLLCNINMLHCSILIVSQSNSIPFHALFCCRCCQQSPAETRLTMSSRYHTGHCISCLPPLAVSRTQLITSDSDTRRPSKTTTD